MRANVTVTLKDGVLDTQGVAVKNVLNSMDGETVSSVRIGKFIEIDVDETDPVKAEEKVKSMCDKLLANPVIENYEIKISAK